ncbi:MAG TPA: sulfite exporter TauE/SafE family protein, partial [Planctomycetaceae bacterium]|nr:sulfite exporter TauE/SafE family protein [Planctomycetaceae bacterium]
MPDFSTTQWALVLLAGFGVGVSKSGFVGVGLFHVVVFAFLFGAKASTGVVLPMLLFGDVCAVAAFRQHARWDYVRRMSLPTGLGVIAGWALMHSLNESAYKPVIGSIILGLAMMQAIRMT